MNRKHLPGSPTTRRTFLTRGALLAAPLVVAAPAAALAGGGAQVTHQGELAARLARLENEAAIHELHQRWLRQVNAGTHSLPDPAVRRVSADPSGLPDRVALATDGHGAIGRYDCLVELEALLPADSTLAQMARAQGHGAVHHSQRRTLRVEYVRAVAGWQIGRLHWET